MNLQERDVVDAVKWLQNGGQERFQNEVLLPPALCIDVKDRAFAVIAEGCFRRADLLVFPCLNGRV